MRREKKMHCQGYENILSHAVDAHNSSVYTVQESHLIVFPVQGVLCDFLTKFRIDLDFRWFK